MVARIAQYAANQVIPAFFTIVIIILQAKSPDTKAAMKPIRRGESPMPAEIDVSEEDSLIKSKSCSPIIGASTIRKENWAILSLFTPDTSPVAIVAPERDRPGATAKACAIPTKRA